RAASQLALDPDSATVRIDDSAGNREAQARAPVLRFAAAPIALKKMRLLLLSNSWTRVGDCESNFVPLCLYSEGDDSTLSSDACRVADQVGDDLQNAISITVDLRKVGLELGGHS